MRLAIGALVRGNTFQDAGGSRKCTHGETDGGIKQLQILHNHRRLRGCPIHLPVCICN